MKVAHLGGQDWVSFEPALLEQLKKAGLHDAVGKLRAHQVVGGIKHRLVEHGPLTELSPGDPAFRQFSPPGTPSKGSGWSVLRIRDRLVGLEAAFSHAKPANSGIGAARQRGLARVAVPGGPVAPRSGGRQDAPTRLRGEELRP